MGRNTNQTRYVGVIEVMDKKLAIELPIDYDFWGRGILLPPIIMVNISREYLGLPQKEGRLYVEVEFVLVDNQHSAAKSFNTTQQSMSLWVKNGKKLAALQKVRREMGEAE